MRASAKEHWHRFRIGDCSFALRSDLPSIPRALDRLYGHRGDSVPAAAPDAAPDEPELLIEVTRRGRLPGRSRWAVHGDGEPFGDELRRSEVLPWVEWAMNWRYLRTCTRWLLVHAASMARGGRGVILPGTSGAGKSTLVAGLVARGWQYFCDEFALVDPRTLQLRPFPKAICVKSGAFATVERLGLRLAAGGRHVKVLKGPVAYVSPADLPADRFAAPCPVDLVAFPRYVPGAPARARPVSRARAAFMLSCGVLNHRSFGAETDSIVAGVVRRASCLSMESGDLGSSCDLLESLLERSC